MKDQISVDINAVSKAINTIRGRSISEAHTSQIIEEYMGGFYSNTGVSVHISWNAQFGRILSQNAEALGIKELKSAQRVKDSRGHETTCSLWAR